MAKWFELSTVALFTLHMCDKCLLVTGAILQALGFKKHFVSKYAELVALV